MEGEKAFARHARSPVAPLRAAESVSCSLPYKYSELTADFFSAEMAPWWKGVSVELGCQFQDWRGLTALVGLQQGWPPQQLEFRLTNQ